MLARAFVCLRKWHLTSNADYYRLARSQTFSMPSKRVTSATRPNVHALIFSRRASWFEALHEFQAEMGYIGRQFGAVFLLWHRHVHLISCQRYLPFEFRNGTLIGYFCANFWCLTRVYYYVRVK